ncbi:MAG: hypothetical protein HRF46_15455 [Acidobacteriota bacterium]
MSRALAYFVTPHGFGHAARACAVIEALAARLGDLRVELFTTTPQWFFEESLSISFGYHPCVCDVGLVQATSLEEDLAATARRLKSEIPYAHEVIEELANAVQALGCQGVACDVSALGVAVAARAGLPSVVVENFTWDWIYSSYASQFQELGEAARYLALVLRGASRRLQTEPACAIDPRAVQAPPVWRQPRQPAADTRERLGITGGQRMVLLTMGGIPWRWDGVGRLRAHSEAVFVVPGGSEAERREGNLVLLPHRTGLYHPDLVQAADVVVGKLGYSTVAEVVGMGKPFAYVPRPTFPESPVLEAYLRQRGACMAIPPHRVATLEWVGEALRLADLGGAPAAPPDGAGMVAQVLLETLFNHK